MPDRFDEFWAIAPRKRGKGAARKAYAKALTIADEDEILTGARRWRQESVGKDPSYICHPATWLNQERWEDEPDAVVSADPEAVWRTKASMAMKSWGRQFLTRQDYEELHSRGLITRERMEEVL
ncbi:MAG: hypothetical protein ACR2RF_26215 [Geminicoccaceae bacterium]